MPYLIDSDAVILYIANQPDIVSLLHRIRTDGLFVSVVTYMEVFEGLERKTTPQAARELFERFLEEPTPILPFSLSVARRCARLRGRRVRPRYLDLITAATALEYDLTLVTRNVADYADVPGLAVHAPP